jgi:tripartite ATP-independent transporter DctP family solute receptor
MRLKRILFLNLQEKKMKNKWMLFALLALAAGSLFASGQQDAETYTLKIAYSPSTTDPEMSPDVKYAHDFKEYVEGESDGRIQVEIYPAGQLGSAAEVVQGVSMGAVDMAVINIAMLNNICDKTMVLALPGLFASVEECNAVVNGEWGQALYDEILDLSGIRVLNSGSNGFRNFTNNVREINKMEDAAGITFRVMESPVSIKMVEAMGAKAVPMPGSEMYVAMQNGVVDGQENPILNILQDLTYEVQTYLTLDGHMASIMSYIISEDVFSSMPGDLQEIVVAGSDLAAEAANGVIERRNVEGLEELKANGMIVSVPSEEDLRVWHETILDASQSYVRDQVGDEVVDSLIAAIQDYR